MKSSAKTTQKIIVKAHVLSAVSTVRFPCYFALLWRTQDNHQIETSKAEAIQGCADFNQDLQIQGSLTFDQISKRYGRYETQFILRLISKQKETEPKMVGRKTLDLGELMNGDIKTGENVELKLQFCSVNGCIKIRFEVQKEQIKVQKIENNVVTSQDIPQSQKYLIKNSKKMVESKEVSAEYIQEFQANKSPRPLISSLPKSPPSNPPSKSHHLISQSEHQASIPIRDSNPLKTVPPPVLDPNTLKSISSESEYIMERKSLTDRFYDSNLESYKLKSLQEEFKRQNSKLMQENELINLTLKQKEDALEEISDQIQTYKKENTKLREDSRKKVQENVDLQLSLASYKEDNMKLTANLVNMQRQNSKICTLMGNLEAEATLCKTEVSKKVISFEDINRQLKECCFDLQSQLKSYESMIQTLHKQINDKNKEITIKEEHFNLQKQELERKQSKLACKNEETSIANNHLQEKVDTLQKELSQMTAHNDALNSIIGQQKNEIKNKFFEIQARQQSQRKMKKDMDNLEQSLIKINEELTQSMKSRQKIQSERIQQRAKLQSVIEKDHLTYKESLKKTEDHLIAQKEQLQEFYSLKLSQKEEEINVCINEKNDLTSKYDSLMQNYRQLELERQSLSQKISQLEELLLANNEIKAKELSQIQEANHQTQILLKGVQQKYSQSQSLLKKYQQKIQIFEVQLTERSSLIDKLQEGLHKQMERSQNLNTKIIHSSEENSTYISKIDILQHELKLITSLCGQAENKENQLKIRINELEAQVYRLANEVEKEQTRSKQIENDLQVRNNIYVMQNQDILNEGLKKDQIINILKQKISSQESHLQILQKKIEKSDCEHKQFIHKSSMASGLLQQQIQKYREDISSKNSEIESLRQKEIEVTTELLRTSFKMQEIKELQQSTKNQAKEELGQKERQLQTMRITLKEMIEATEEKEQTYKGTIEELYMTIQTMTLQNQQKTEKDTEAMIQLSETVKKLQKNLKQLQNENESSQNELIAEKNKEKVLQQLEQKVQKLQKELEKNKKYQQSIQDNIDSSKKQHQEYIQQLQQILREKSEEIESLNLDVSRLAAEAQEVFELRQQAVAYKEELEINSEEIFNLQAAHNELRMQMEDMKLINEKLTSQNTVLNEKINELEIYIIELENIEGKSDDNLRVELSELRSKFRRLQSQNDALQEELDQKDEQHVVELIDQHIRLSKSDLQNSNLAKSASKLPRDSQPDFLETCNILKNILTQRKSLQNVLSLNLQRKSPSSSVIEDIPKYSQTISLQLLRAKSMLLKNSVKSDLVREALKDSELAVRSLCQFVEKCCFE